MNSVKFKILDVDYTMLDNGPLIRIIGKTPENKTITVFYRGFYPYFYSEYDEKIEKILKDFSNLIVKVEFVRKYKPIGYEKEKNEFLKITLKDPSKVPEVREKLNLNNIRTYEADILFKYRFLADFNLYPLKCYEAIGEFVNNTTTALTELKFEAKEFRDTEDFETDYKILSLDIEVISAEFPNPEEKEVAIISLYFSHEYKGKKKLVLVNKKERSEIEDVLFFQNEKEMLQTFLKIVNEYDPDIIVGYNIISFDFPYLKKRFEKNGLKFILGRIKKEAKVEKVGEEKYKVSIPGRIVFDVYLSIKEFSKKGAFNFKRLGLDDVSKIVLGEGKIFVEHSKIIKYWNEGGEKFKELINYASKDAELALKLFYKLNLFPIYVQLARISGTLLQDVLEGSESVRIENLLLREFNKHDFIIPNKPNKKELEIRKKEKGKLKGAIVFEPKVGLQENIIYLDFKSLYPSLIVQYNLCPTTIQKEDSNVKFVEKEIREGIIPKILLRLIEERDKIKKLMKDKGQAEKEKLNAEQQALKILANAFYGYLGFIKARFFILDLANTITSLARMWITKLKEIVEKELGREVVYGDTDSVMIKGKSKDLKELFEEATFLENEINKKLPQYIKVKVEGIFKRIIFLTKKKYAGLLFEDLEKNKLVFKGIEIVRRDWCPLVEEVLSNVLSYILIENDTKKAFEYVEDIIKKLRKNEIEVEKLAITKTLTKPINKYKGQQPHVELVKKMIKRKEPNVPGIGDRISYVIVAGPQKIVERAESIEYVKRNNLPIDSEYYIFHQLLPPLERILEAIGIGKSQLINGTKQLNLLELKLKKTEDNKIKSQELIGIVCGNCNTTFRRVPLSLKCYICNSSDFYFYSSNNKSKTIQL